MATKNELSVCCDVNLLHPYVKQQALLVVECAKKRGLNVGIFETLRTRTRQKWLFSNGKSKTMQSYHLLGLAVDFVFLTAGGKWTWDRPKADWDKLAGIMEEFGFSSLWKRSGWDGPHGEFRFKGVTTAQLYKWWDKCEKEEDFYSQYIDDLIKKCYDPDWLKPDVIIEAEIPYESPNKQPVPVTPITPEPKETIVITDKQPNRFEAFIAFILSLFGRK